MCERSVKDKLEALEFVPDYFETQKICDKAVKGDLYLLLLVPDWFVTQKQLKIWHDDDEYCDDDEFVEWYNRYKKRKAQKIQIKKELMPIAWHPSSWWNWCVPEDEKKRKKICGHKHGLFVSGDRIQKNLTLT